MLVDLARRGWAAAARRGEVWRCVAPHADAEGIGALVRASKRWGEERLSVALALQQLGHSASMLPFSRQG